MADLQSETLATQAPHPEGICDDTNSRFVRPFAQKPETQHFDPDLQVIIKAWPTLPAAIKRAMRALIGERDGH